MYYESTATQLPFVLVHCRLALFEFGTVLNLHKDEQKYEKCNEGEDHYFLIGVFQLDTKNGTLTSCQCNCAI